MNELFGTWRPRKASIRSPRCEELGSYPARRDPRDARRAARGVLPLGRSHPRRGRLRGGHRAGPRPSRGRAGRRPGRPLGARGHPRRASRRGDADDRHDARGEGRRRCRLAAGARHRGDARLPSARSQCAPDRDRAHGRPARGGPGDRARRSARVRHGLPRQRRHDARRDRRGGVRRRRRGWPPRQRGRIPGRVRVPAARAPDEAREVASGLASLRAAMPGIAAPAAPIAADDVETIAHDVQRELREAVGAQAGAATASAREIEDATKDLAATSAALRSSDRTAAATAFREFRSAWLRIEDAVRGRDRDAYRSIETDMATASTLLASPSADLAATDRAVSRIAETLAPLAATTKTYGAFDAAIILLREGVEALLVVAALLAFLARSGNGDKRRWVWAGGAAGIGASVVVAILVSVVFSASTAAGVDPELIEGITGVLAAAMLVYMSFWLHSKSNLRAWDRYIRDKSASALARNSLLSLAVIAFLAVFREGSETVLFYFGIASSIATLDLLGGLAAGTAGLAALGVLVLVFGVRVPLRPFFIGASVLVYYLAFKFLGSGIHALQVVGIVPATPAAVPDIGLLGVFPTWETTAVQIALLAGAAAVIVLGRVRVPSLPSRA